MRKAAGIMLLVLGIYVIAAVLLSLLLDSEITAQAWGFLALSVLIVGGGISAIRKRAYWWAFSGAIGLVLLGIISAVLHLTFTAPLAPYIDPAMRVLEAVAPLCFYGIPGLLALIFLVKRKGEFQS